MDFEFSSRARERCAGMWDFMRTEVLPAETEYEQYRAARGGHAHPPIVEQLKKSARRRGLWNLFLPAESGLSNVDCAAIAEVSGWSPVIAPEAINYQAPDSGNMETLQLFATAHQREQWLRPLRSCAAQASFSQRMINPPVPTRSPDMHEAAAEAALLRRQIELWNRSWGGERVDDVRVLSEWLVECQPRSERRTLVHGDAKINNLIFHASRPEVVAVLDWELCGVGEPMFDLAHIWASTWGTKPEECGGVLDVDLTAMQLPVAEEFFAAYNDFSSSHERLLPFHKVFGLFRYAGIFHGIGRRAAAGSATAADAEQQGGKAHAYLDRALQLMTAG